MFGQSRLQRSNKKSENTTEKVQRPAGRVSNDQMTLANTFEFDKDVWPCCRYCKTDLLRRMTLAKSYFEKDVEHGEEDNTSGRETGMDLGLDASSDSEGSHRCVTPTLSGMNLTSESPYKRRYGQNEHFSFSNITTGDQCLPIEIPAETPAQFEIKYPEIKAKPEITVLYPNPVAHADVQADEGVSDEWTWTRRGSSISTASRRGVKKQAYATRAI